VGSCGIDLPGEIAGGIAGDEAFTPLAGLPLDEVKWQGVEQFIAEDDAWERIGGESLVMAGEIQVVCERGEGLVLGGVEAGQRLRDGVLEGGEGLGLEGADGGEHIGGEGAIVRAAFEDAPAPRRAEFVPLAEEAAGEERAKQWADADAGEEVAGASDLVSFAGVVAGVWVIECGCHEGGEWEGAVGANFFP